jgi:hypothetical protein
MGARAIAWASLDTSAAAGQSFGSQAEMLQLLSNKARPRRRVASRSEPAGVVPFV